MLGQVVVVYCLTQSQNWPFLGLKTTLKATDSAPRLQFQFTSLFSPPSKYWANFDNQFTTLLSQVRKPGLDAQPFALRPVHNIILRPHFTSSPACSPSTAIPGLLAAFVVSRCRPRVPGVAGKYKLVMIPLGRQHLRHVLIRHDPVVHVVAPGPGR